MLLNRYVIVKLLGRGCYSSCWLARDCKLELYVAVKVYRGAPYYREVAVQEFDRLFALNQLQLEVQRTGGEPIPVVRLFDMFLLNGWMGSHVCLVLELLGDSLAHLLDFYRDETVLLINPGIARSSPHDAQMYSPRSSRPAPSRPHPHGHQGSKLPRVSASAGHGNQR